MSTERKTDQRFAVICYAAAVCISTVLSVIVGAAVPSGTNLYIYLAYLFPQLTYIAVFAVMWRGYKKPFKAILIKEDVSAIDYLFGAVIAIALLFFALLPNIGITKLFEIMGVKASVTVPRMEKWHELLLCGLIICVLPAIGEELVFRKAFCDGMSEVADYKTVLLAGLCFSLSHLNPAQTVHQFVLGCALALVYVKTRNITVTMLMHFINNVLALFLERITGAELWNNITVAGICFAAGAVALGVTLFLFMKKGRRLDNGKQGKPERLTVTLIAVLAAAWIITFGLSFI